MINTIKHLCYLLKTSPDELEAIVKNTDKFYYEIIEIKKNKDSSPMLDAQGRSKQRVLYPSMGRLKQIQKLILKQILENIDIPDYAYGAIKGRDNVKNAKRHQGKKYFFTLDLKDFFPTVNHRMVFEMFRLKNFSPTVARILTQLATYKGCVPQGAPT
ncbi:MAG TPA: reverse transcriptase domain-containing protein, partial [Ignavibacteriaceae bacterium]